MTRINLSTSPERTHEASKRSDTDLTTPETLKTHQFATKQIQDLAERERQTLLALANTLIDPIEEINDLVGQLTVEVDKLKAKKRPRVPTITDLSKKPISDSEATRAVKQKIYNGSIKKSFWNSIVSAVKYLFACYFGRNKSPKLGRVPVSIQKPWVRATPTKNNERKRIYRSYTQRSDPGEINAREVLNRHFNQIDGKISKKMNQEATQSGNKRIGKETARNKKRNDALILNQLNRLLSPEILTTELSEPKPENNSWRNLGTILSE